MAGDRSASASEHARVWGSPGDHRGVGAEGDDDGDAGATWGAVKEGRRTGVGAGWDNDGGARASAGAEGGSVGAGTARENATGGGALAVTGKARKDVERRRRAVAWEKLGAGTCQNNRMSYSITVNIMRSVGPEKHKPIGCVYA